MRHGGNLCTVSAEERFEQEEHLQQERDKPIMSALYLVGDGIQAEESETLREDQI